MSDADLLAVMRADLAASPVVGESHRKVWARLRILRDIRVSKDRVCRLIHWRLEKLGFMSPLEVRQSYAIREPA